MGFEQFGLPTVVIGLLMAYSGAGFYALRMMENRRRKGLPGLGRSVHVKLTGAMLLVLGGAEKTVPLVRHALIR